MIRGNEVDKFEKELLRREKVDLLRNFKIVAALHKEAVALGVLPGKNPLEGLEVNIRIAKVINRV